MFSIAYNTALFLYALCMLPRFFFRWNQYKHSLGQKLGFSLPRNRDKPLIWIHAVSLGETRAVVSLFKELRRQFKQHSIVISTTTATGQIEAKKSMPDADGHFFLPFDFSWVIKKTIRQLKPSCLILVEGDAWYHLLKEAKKWGAYTVLVNGKISLRSLHRFQYLPAFAKRLFSLFDTLCVQSALYKDRFLSLGVPEEKLHVTGNLKLDALPDRMAPAVLDTLRQELGIVKEDRVLVIGSTHAPEELELLLSLKALWKEIPKFKVILVPRHPERFSKVAALLKKQGFPTLLYSERAHKQGDEQVILIDSMGKLNACYQLAEVALVAGSFASHVGGHNLFEPIFFHVPVLFGPHTHKQPDLQQLILQARAGAQVTLEELPNTLLDWLRYPTQRQAYVDACSALCTRVQGTVRSTLDIVTSANLIKRD